MPRGPFQGTWQQGSRPTVVTAPDALVYINGRPDLTACPKCRRRFDLNKYVTSVQVDLSVENAPGSASIGLSVPRHSLDDFLVDGVPIVSAMMEVEIYAKGYYLVGGMPQYYPIFWGLVTDVADNFSGGENTFSINCADILKWWELCRLNTNVALTQAAGQLGRDNVTGNVYHAANVYDVIWTLAEQSFGDIVQVQGSLVSATREERFPGTFSGLRKDIMAYWNSRFGQMRSNLMLYGIEGAGVRGDAIYASQPTAFAATSQRIASTAVRNANGGEASSQVLFDPNAAIPFRSNIANAGSPNLWQSEFQTKLEIANICKEAIGFEFFMDVTGDIVFKPPFYNLDVLGNKPLSWIQDVDIIDWNLSESEAEVITQLQMSGTFDGGPQDHGVTSDYNTPVVQVTDYHLLRQYGWRVQTMNSEWLSNPESMFYAGLDMLDRINSRRHRSTVTIPMRPELRLGFPVYLAPKDQIWYVSGISHNLSFGGRAQTSLTLTARRGKFIAPKGIGTLEMTQKPLSADIKRDVDRTVAAIGGGVPIAERKGYTSRELADASGAAIFKLTAGLGAELPPTNLQVAQYGQEPYEPLMLRHPKTGRIVGYPNVVMAYTREYDPDEKTFKQNTGKDVTGERKAAELKKTGNAAAKDNERLVESSLVQNEARSLADRHLDGRYTFGMTSAGVYSYAYDKSKVILELLQLPRLNIQVASEDPALANLTTATVTIRPVSDERGFELIGHYRYGRGISLRDGSLVLTKDKNNVRAAVDTQLALAGGLYETLQGQSHGLTTLSTGYGNPADVVARMTAWDLQTAAAVNPETREPVFMSAGDNFVDTAPLNSPANRGAVASVEASQLSRALTVAEMRPKTMDTPDADCVCLLGRSDLAFINVGYQVEFLKGAAPDRSGFASTTLGRQLAELNEQLVAVRGQLAETNDPLAIAEGVENALASEEATILAQIRQLEQQKARITGDDDPVAALSTSLDLNSPVSEATTLELGLTLQKVELFLQNLYEVLDTPHQEYERALRGQLIEGPSRSSIINSNVNQTPPSPYSPPFSVPGRALGGDPEAIALQGSSAVQGLSQSWKTFGDHLRREPKRAALNREIDAAKDKLRRLVEEERRLRGLAESRSVLVGASAAVNLNASLVGVGVTETGPIDVPSRLAAVQSELNDTTRKLGNAEAKLRILEGTQ